MSQLEELVMAEQQKALVQSVIARLTEMAFDNCITKPSSSLSSSEQGCIQVGRWVGLGGESLKTGVF